MAQCRARGALSAGGCPRPPGWAWAGVRRWRVILPALLLLTSAPRAHSDPEPQSLLRLGLLLPPDEPEATCLRHGATLAAELLGTLRGRPVEVVVRGRTGQWGDDGVEAGHLALDDGVSGFIAPSSGAGAHLTLQVAGRTAIPVVVLCSDSSVLGARIPWMAQMVPTTRAEAAWLFRRLLTNQTQQSCTAFVPEGRAGREISADLAASATEAGVQLSPPCAVPVGSPDYSNLLKNLATNWPPLIGIWLDPEPAALLIKNLRTLGYVGPLVGPGRLDSQEFLAAAGSAAEGVLISGPVLPADGVPERQAFVEAYARRHQVMPDMMALLAADAVRLLADLISSPELSAAPPSFRNARYPGGFTGPLEFGDDGRRCVALQLRVCRQGRFETVPR